MNQFLVSIVLAVLVTSAATYLLTTMSMQSAGIENKSPVTADAGVTDVAPPKIIQQIESDTKSWITSKTTKIELSCLESCDDGNACTYDYCNKTTDFKCVHTILKGEVEGCKGLVQGSCYKNSCVSGTCTLIYSSTCCGNNKCDADEDYTLCPRDCEQIVIQQTTQTEQTLSLSLTISVAKNPIVRGNNQTITIKVTDGSNDIVGVSVSCTVTYASGIITKDCSGTTNANGEHSYTWKIGSNSRPGTFTVIASASKSGYISDSASTSFQVTTASG